LAFTFKSTIQELDMTAYEYGLWVYYDQLTGRVSGAREDYQRAIQSDVIARSMGGMKDTNLQDWIYPIKEDNEEANILQQKAYFQSLIPNGI